MNRFFEFLIELLITAVIFGIGYLIIMLINIDIKYLEIVAAILGLIIFIVMISIVSFFGRTKPEANIE